MESLIFEIVIFNADVPISLTVSKTFRTKMIRHYSNSFTDLKSYINSNNVTAIIVNVRAYYDTKFLSVIVKQCSQNLLSLTIAKLIAQNINYNAVSKKYLTNFEIQKELLINIIYYDPTIAKILSNTELIALIWKISCLNECYDIMENLFNKLSHCPLCGAKCFDCYRRACV